MYQYKWIKCTFDYFGCNLYQYIHKYTFIAKLVYAFVSYRLTGPVQY